MKQKLIIVLVSLSFCLAANCVAAFEWTVFEAARNNKAEILKQLLANGADPDQRVGVRNETALIRAAFWGHTEIVNLLIEAGADPSAKDNGGNTAFHEAVSRGKREVAKLLFEKGAECDARNDMGLTPFFLAAANGQQETAIWMLELGADPNIRSEAVVDTPVSYAAKKDQIKLLEALIEKKADINVVGDGGNMPLHHGASRCNSRIVTALLQAGADVDIMNERGMTPLHMAANSSYPDQTAVIDLLLKAGADISKKTKGGKTAIDILHDRLEKAATFHDQGVSKDVAKKYVDEIERAINKLEYHTKQAAKAKRKKQGLLFLGENTLADAGKGTETIKPASVVEVGREAASPESSTNTPEQSCRNKICSPVILTMVIGVALLAGIVILIVKKKD